MVAPSFILRPAAQRGLTDLGWLRSHHTFSFGEYYDPNQMGYHSLRVLNDDLVAPGNGFGTHSHRNMEIFSLVIHGELEHKDSLGNGQVIGAGQFQYMSAGEGILHSEFNPSERETSRFLQIWITPEVVGGEPRYQDLQLNGLSTNTLSPLAGPDHDKNTPIAIRQQARIDYGQFDLGHEFDLESTPEQPAAWLQLIHGQLQYQDHMINPGDGVALKLPIIGVKATEASAFLLIRMR